MLTLQITLKLDVFIVIISVPVSHLTVEEAHKEFNSLVDRIAAKHEQLDFVAVGTLAFNAKSTELAVLFPHMSQLCKD